MDTVMTLAKPRILLAASVLAVLVALPACGGSDSSSKSQQLLLQQGELYQIDQIERKWHEALSRHQIALMMSLWAPNATWTAAPGVTLTGKGQIRRFWLTKTPAFDPKLHWVLDTPAYKIRETANGDKGTLYFECDHIKLPQGKVIAVTASDMQVAKMGGRWLITNNVGATPKLSS